jgi:hypothetical protein
MCEICGKRQGSCGLPDERRVRWCGACVASQVGEAAKGVRLGAIMCEVCNLKQASYGESGPPPNGFKMQRKRWCAPCGKANNGQRIGVTKKQKADDEAAAAAGAAAAAAPSSAPTAAAVRPRPPETDVPPVAPPSKRGATTASGESRGVVAAPEIAPPAAAAAAAGPQQPAHLRRKAGSGAKLPQEAMDDAS